MEVYFLNKPAQHDNSGKIRALILKNDLFNQIPTNSIILAMSKNDTTEGRPPEELPSYTAYWFTGSSEVIRLASGLHVFSEIDKTKREADFISIQEFKNIFTLIYQEKTYLELYQNLGTQTWNLLNTLRDIHYCAHFKAEYDILKNLKEQQGVDWIIRRRSFKFLQHTGFKDFVNTFQLKKKTIYKNVIQTQMKLKGITQSTKVNINFRQRGIVKSNIAALIGKNGVGKSRSLKVVKNHLTRNAQFRKIISINLYESVNNARTPDYVSLKIDPREKINFASAILRLLDKGQRAGYFNSTKILREIIQSQLKCFDIRFKAEENKWISIWNSQPGDGFSARSDIKFYRKNGSEFILSQGQKNLLSFTVLLLLYLEKNSIVLIDEPEGYLHPNYIISLVDLLQKLLKHTESVALIATHSIFLVRELPSSSVYVITEDEDGVRIVSPQSETLGANLDRLAYEFFSDEDISKKYEEFVSTKSRLLKRKPRKERLSILEKLPGDLASKILSK